MREILVNKRGFTLIEIVTVIVVLGILAVFTFSFIDNAVKTYSAGATQRMLYQEASIIMERLIRETRDMVNPSSWSNGTTSDILQFDKAHGTLQDLNTTITFRRDANTNRLFRDSGGTSKPIGQNVTQFLITRWGPNVCNRGLSVSITLADRGQSFTLSSTISPKNLGAGVYNDRCFNGDYEDVIQQ